MSVDAMMVDEGDAGEIMRIGSKAKTGTVMVTYVDDGDENTREETVSTRVAIIMPPSCRLWSRRHSLRISGHAIIDQLTNQQTNPG